MDFAAWHSVVTDDNGAVVPQATITVRHTDTGALARLYSVRDGSEPKGNPFQTGIDGMISFFASGGAYTVIASKGTLERRWSFVPIGTAQEYDIDGLAEYLNSGVVYYRTYAEMAASSPANFPAASVVLSDADGSKNGYYTNDGTGWVFARTLPDSIARASIYSGNVNNPVANISAGINPSAPIVFFLDVEDENTGSVTLAIDGIGSGVVLNAAGNVLSAGEWFGRVMLTREEDGRYRIVNDPASAIAAALSATQAGTARDDAVTAKDLAEIFAGDANDSANDSATSATSSSDSATASAGSAAAAENSATVAAGSASTATTKASEAASSASDAANSATTATTKAGEASASATAAAGSATTATNQANRAEDEADRAESAAGGLVNAVQFVPQTLTPAQQEQARDNIGSASIAQGDKADTAVSFESQSLTSAQQAQARDNINAAGKRSVREKWLFSSDWQAIPEDPAQVAYQRSAMSAITAQHPHIDFAFYPGDVVDRASNNGDGTAPSYGYPEFRADVESRMNIPWERWQFLPGNHDRDGTGLGNFKESWSYMTYRKHMGPEYYTVRKGNVAHIFIGDMAGSNSGEIFPYVLEWLDKELNKLSEYNVFCWFHQPLHGVHPSSLSETSAWSQYQGATGLRPVLAKYSDRIVFCGYGHVGVSLSSGTTFSTLDGIEWVNFSMAIPSMANDGWTEPGVYSIAELNQADSTIYVERWNLDTGTPLPAHSKSIPLKHPLNLGGSDWAFDGRSSVDPMNGVFTGPISSYTSQAETRVLNGSIWEPSHSMAHAFKAYLGDDSNDAGGEGIGVGIGFYAPGTLTQNDDQGFLVTGWPSPYYLAAEIGSARTYASESNKHSKVLVRASNQDGVLEDVFSASASGMVAVGINVLNGGGVRVGDGDSLDKEDSVGAQFHPNNYVKVSRPSFCGMFIRHTTPGSMLSFQYGQSAVVGNISVTATSTVYNTSSDKTLKDDKGKLTYEDALAIFELISIHNFDWKATGESDIGVFAQDLYEIYPNAVSVGGWYCSDMDVPCDEDYETAVYKPWSVDYSKLIPVMVRVIQGLLKGNSNG